MNAIATTAPTLLWKEASTLIHQLFGLFGEPQQIARQQLLGRDAHALLSKWLRAAEMFLRQLLLIEASALSPPQTTVRPSTSSGNRLVEPVETKQRHRCDADHPESWQVSFRVFTLAARARAQQIASARHRARKPSRDETYRFDFIDPESARAWKELQRGVAVSSPVYGGSVGRAAHDEGGGAKISKPTATPSDRFVITSPVNGGGKAAPQPLYSAWPLARRAEALLRAYNDPLPYAKRLARKLHAHPERAESIVDCCANPHAHHGVLHANLAIEIWTYAAQTLRRWTKPNDSS